MFIVPSGGDLMRRTVAVRLFAVVVAAGSLAASSALPAGAAVVKGTTCTKATFKTDLVKGTSTSALSGCSNPAATGGTGTLVANFKNLKKITAKVTWKGTGTVTYTITEKGGPAAANKCKTPAGGKQDGLIVSTGKFVSGTGAALAAFKGTIYTESLCVTSKSATYLNPGSKIVFK
jgi:hypothetical protein